MKDQVTFFVFTLNYKDNTLFYVTFCFQSLYKSKQLK